VFLQLADNVLVPETGLENKGHLEYLDTSAQNGGPFFQVNFVSDLEATIIAAPTIFSDVPRFMLINNNDVDQYTYAAAS
jgi:hypothetical protein